WELSRFVGADGLVDPAPPARDALTRHRLAARSFSATALQALAACPYRFYLRALVRLEPAETFAPVEDLDPLQRGSFVHEAQRRVLVDLRDRGWLPLGRARVEDALVELDRVVDDLAEETGEELCPAI